MSLNLEAGDDQIKRIGNNIGDRGARGTSKAIFDGTEDLLRSGSRSVLFVLLFDSMVQLERILCHEFSTRLRMYASMLTR